MNKTQPTLVSIALAPYAAKIGVCATVAVTATENERSEDDEEGANVDDIFLASRSFPFLSSFCDMT